MFAVRLPQMGQVHEGFCENCGQRTLFVYIGAQKFPPRVAEKLRIAPVVQQWRCQQCHTTVSISDAESVA